MQKAAAFVIAGVSCSVSEAFAHSSGYGGGRPTSRSHTDWPPLTWGSAQLHVCPDRWDRIAITSCPARTARALSHQGTVFCHPAALQGVVMAQGRRTVGKLIALGSKAFLQNPVP